MKNKLFLLFLLGFPGLLWADAGELRFVQGDVKIQRAGGQVEAAVRGSRVQEGDTIQTGASGYAQLVMIDEAIIAVRPDTQLKLDTYRYAGKTDGGEKGVLSLVRGGFRSITGWIGRQNKDAYSVRTPTATIGIRGTDHEPLVIPLPRAGEKSLGEPGTYNKVNSGQTYIQSAAGRVELGPNQAGFSPALANAAPVRLPQIPSFMRSTPPVRSEVPSRTGEPAEVKTVVAPAPTPAATADAAVPAPAVTSLAAESSASVMLTANSMVASAPVVLSKSLPGALGPGTLLLGNHDAPAGFAAAGGELTPGQLLSNGAVVVGNPVENGAILLGPDGLPLRVSSTGGFKSGGGFLYDPATAPVSSKGGTTLAGAEIIWGVYAGGVIQDSMGQRYPQYFFFMGGGDASSTATLSAALPNATSTLVFSSVGGFTKPVSQDGSLGGTVNAISIGLNNLGGSVSVFQYNLKVTDAHGAVWTASMPTPESLSTFLLGATSPVTNATNTVPNTVTNTVNNGPISNLTASCTGCPAGAVAGVTAGVISGTGTARGVVIGNPLPLGVVSSYSLRAGTSGVGGAVLAK